MPINDIIIIDKEEPIYNDGNGKISLNEINKDYILDEYFSK